MKSKKNINYEINITHEITYEPLSKYTEVEKFIEGNQLFIIKHEKIENKTGFYNDNKSTVKTNIKTKDYLNALLDNPENEAEIDKKYSLAHPVILVEKEFIPNFKLTGLHYLYDQFKDVEKNQVKDPATLMGPLNFENAINKEKYEFLQLIPDKNHIKIFRKADGENLMSSFLLDDTRGQCHNEKYHLDEFVESLTHRKDIIFIADSNRYSKYNTQLLFCPLKGDEEGMSKIISDIPSYNSTEERTEEFSMIYTPQPQDVEKIMNWKQNNKDENNYDITTFIVYEILEGKKFAKHPVVEEEEVVVPKRKFKK